MHILANIISCANRDEDALRDVIGSDSEFAAAVGPYFACKLLATNALESNPPEYMNLISTRIHEFGGKKVENEKFAEDCKVYTDEYYIIHSNPFRFGGKQVFASSFPLAV